MGTDEMTSTGETAQRMTRASKRAMIKEFKLDRPLPNTRAAVNARARSQKWRDERHDSGVPDNRLLGNLALKILLRVDAEKRVIGKQGMDVFFESFVEELPSRFDRVATANMLKRYRDQAFEQLLESQVLDDVNVRRTTTE